MRNRDSNWFDFEGFASREDLEEDSWRSLYDKMAHDQAEFLSHEALFRSPEYMWPRDPLNTWSRVWEYPYVFTHVDRLVRSQPDRVLKVADIGSGVTFFPFTLARLGCEVTCIDIDPVCLVDIPRAAACHGVAPGRVGVALSSDGRIPLADASQDIVYCISVLEHIEHFEETLAEMARILRPGGHLILTCDIDLKGNFSLGAAEFSRLQRAIDTLFIHELPPRITHPSACLNTVNGPWMFPRIGRKEALRTLLGQLLRRQWPQVDPRIQLLLTVYATVLRK